MTQRKLASSNKRRLENIVSKLQDTTKLFSDLGMESAHTEISAYVAAALGKQTGLIEKMPIGIRFEGEFYIRKPYSADFESIKIEDGAAFMREDLVSWTIERSKGDIHNAYAHYRDIFKDKRMREVITQEHAVLVYAEEQDC